MEKRNHDFGFENVFTLYNGKWKQGKMTFILKQTPQYYTEATYYSFVVFISSNCSSIRSNFLIDWWLPDWQESQRSLNLGITRPSPGSTTLEDVLDSLLGLPSQPARIPTPQPSPRKASSPYYFMGGKVLLFKQLFFNNIIWLYSVEWLHTIQKYWIF